MEQNQEKNKLNKEELNEEELNEEEMDKVTGGGGRCDLFAEYSDYVVEHAGEKTGRKTGKIGTYAEIAEMVIKKHGLDKLRSQD